MKQLETSVEMRPRTSIAKYRQHDVRARFKHRAATATEKNKNINSHDDGSK